jgi:uncharacterized membrane protein (DUF441 family)
MRPSQRPPLGRDSVGRSLGALGLFLGAGTAVTFFSGIPRKAAASFALLMLIVPAPGGPPQPQQLSTAPAMAIAIEVVPIPRLFFIDHAFPHVERRALPF